jgi:hypothetical protein
MESPDVNTQQESSPAPVQDSSEVLASLTPEKVGSGETRENYPSSRTSRNRPLLTRRKRRNPLLRQTRKLAKPRRSTKRRANALRVRKNGFGNW